MDKIISLYDELNKAGVRFYHWRIDGCQAATIELDGRYGVFVDFDSIRTSSEELVLISHEGGHICTGATHRVDSPFDLIERHENKADKWAIQRLISQAELDQAVTDGYTSVWQLAEYFNVTEDFMRKALCWYIHGNLAADLYF